MNLFLEITYDLPLSGGHQRIAGLGTVATTQIQANPSANGRRCQRKKKNMSNKQTYNWNYLQNKKYVNFLVKRRQLFDLSNEQRKCMKINVIMSEAISSRTSSQCHCHHQKMMLKHGGSIQSIIKAHKHLLSTKNIPKRSMVFLSQIFQQNMNENQIGGRESFNKKQEMEMESSLLRFDTPISSYFNEGSFFDCNI